MADTPKQGPPIAFRPGPDLSQLVERFAAEKGIGQHEAFKCLAALAVFERDVRDYDAVAAAAKELRGHNAFVRALLRSRPTVTVTRRR